MTENYIKAWVAVDPYGVMHVESIRISYEVCCLDVSFWPEHTALKWNDLNAQGWNIQPITIIDGHDFYYQVDDGK